MKKILLCILLAFTLVPIWAQEFLVSPDYIYGCASDRNETRADSLALLSLSRAVNVDVESFIKSEYRERNGSITQIFDNQVSVRSKLSISGVRKYVEKEGRGYKVYYYFNKRELVENSEREYQSKVLKAREMEKSDEYHAKNLALGHYYNAYKIMSSELLNAIYPRSKVLASYTMDDIKQLYAYMGYRLSCRTDNGRQQQLWVRDENSKTLPGFEYYSIDGKWKAPVRFLDLDAQFCSNAKEYKWAHVESITKEFRFTFEELVNGRIMKINVPESFYYLSGRKMLFIF